MYTQCVIYNLQSVSKSIEEYYILYSSSVIWRKKKKQFQRRPVLSTVHSPGAHGRLVKFLRVATLTQSSNSSTQRSFSTVWYGLGNGAISSWCLNHWLYAYSVQKSRSIRLFVNSTIPGWCIFPAASNWLRAFCSELSTLCTSCTSCTLSPFYTFAIDILLHFTRRIESSRSCYSILGWRLSYSVALGVSDTYSVPTSYLTPYFVLRT